MRRRGRTGSRGSADMALARPRMPSPGKTDRSDREYAVRNSVQIAKIRKRFFRDRAGWFLSGPTLERAFRWLPLARGRAGPMVSTFALTSKSIMAAC